RNVEKMEEERHTPQDEHILGLSIALDIPISILLPEARHWIASAACILCGPSSDMTLPEALAYADYRLVTIGPPFAQRFELSLKGLRDSLRWNAKAFSTVREVEAAVLKVAQRLGIVLLSLKGKAQ